MSVEILVNVTPRESRAAVVLQGVVQEFYLERTNRRGLAGNINKGRATRVCWRSSTRWGWARRRRPPPLRETLASMGPLGRDEKITAVAFAVMVTGWIFADHLKLNVTSIAFAGLGVLLMANVLTLDDIAKQGDTLATFLWLAVLFALSGQLNELGFMGFAGQKLAAQLGGLSWPVTYVTLVVLYVAIQLHVREPVLAGAGAARCLPRRWHPRRRAGPADGVRAAVREQLLLGDHASR